MTDPTTEELRVLQRKREAKEREAAEDAPEDTGEHEVHAARADKAAYLREKLEERARAEREKAERP